MNELRVEKKRQIYLFIAIPFLFYAFFVIVPFFIAIYNSLFNWKGGPTKTFIGFGNYVRMMGDRHWKQAMLNNFKAILVALGGMTFFGYILSLLLHSPFVKGRKVYRFIIFLPVILSSVVVGYIFSMVLNQNPGLLNTVLGVLGLESWQQIWLGDRDIAIIATDLSAFPAAETISRLSSFSALSQDWMYPALLRKLPSVSRPT